MSRTKGLVGVEAGGFEEAMIASSILQNNRLTPCNKCTKSCSLYHCFPYSSLDLFKSHRVAVGSF